ncbi:unnamed protein product [Schistosoma mattheei]|uniref:Uncharacterized protein n=1 Tax=Schistosoma mattheei TaxID=31246 RepID=A0A183Q419_9TREM|nr:unnamed protein product [Schistosoma mattheei]
MSEMSPGIHLSIKEQLDRIVIEMMKGSYISIKKADQILDLFRARYPELPTSVRSVLRRCNGVEPENLESGTYYHLGLKSTLLRTSENLLRKIRFTELKLQLNYDGLSLFKSSNQQLWPTPGHIRSSLVSNVFIIGIYSGEVKPYDFNDMSAALITELQELLTVGINVDKFHVHLTVKLAAVIYGAPARSNIRYVVGHNATASCDKRQVLGTRTCGRMTLPNGEHDLRSDVTFRSYEKCYGSDQIFYNVHSLKHIVEDVIEHGSLESFSAFPFESYMRKIRRSVHCGFATAKQAAQLYAEEVYFQSILNQDMADNVTEPEITDDSSEQIVSYGNSKLSTTRPDNVVIASGRPGTVKRKNTGYLCTSEELEVAEVEAGFAPVEFPVVNILTGNFSPIASLCDDANKMLRTLLKSVSELSTKIDEMLFLYERLAMGVTDRRTEEMHSDAIHFPLRTHKELRSLEAALENQKYRDHFNWRTRTPCTEPEAKSVLVSTNFTRRFRRCKLPGEGYNTRHDYSKPGLLA